MSDIIERLRACQGVLTHDPECNCAEAADEIERLRARDALWDKANQDNIETIAKLRAEIERLTRLLDAFHNGTETAADNARLRTVLESIAENSDDEWAFREARAALEPKP